MTASCGADSVQRKKWVIEPVRGEPVAARCGAHLSVVVMVDRTGNQAFNDGA
jgi:hypothetical protein